MENLKQYDGYVPHAPQRVFCTQCGTELSGNAAFCSACGAPVAPAPQAAPVAQPTPVAAANPYAATFSAPAMETPPSHLAEKPAFPLISVIMLGVSAFIAFMSFCISNLSFLGFMEFSAISAIVVGMILDKKEKKLIVAIGFLALAFFTFLSSITSFSGSYFWTPGRNILSLLWNSFTWMAIAAIGVFFLIGKNKLKILKIVGCAVGLGMSFFAMLTWIGWVPGSAIFSFLQASALYAGAFLYDPYK